MIGLHRRWTLVSLSLLLVGGVASSRPAEEDRLFGEWRFEVAGAGGRARTALLSLFRTPQGKPAGEWMSGWRMREVEDLRIQADRIRFTREGRRRDGQPARWEFEGTLEQGKLTGKLLRDGEERKVTGERLPPKPGLVGNYAFGYTGKRVNAILSVRADRAGKVTAAWRHDRGVDPVPDFSHEDGKVTFTYQGLEFEGSLKGQGNRLSGKFDTASGKTQVDAFRMGTDLIGVWDLEVTSERGSRKQRLKVYRDMSGYYGALPIERIHLEDDNPVRRQTGPRAVTFEAAWEVGERTVELRFEGKLSEAGKLTGELRGLRGSARIVGERRLESEPKE